MHQARPGALRPRSGEDDLLDLEALPEDGRQAWFSLLLISLVTAAAGTLLYAVIRVLA